MFTFAEKMYKNLIRKDMDQTVKNQLKKSQITYAVIASVFVLTLMVSCNKYDKMSIVGKWEIDVKATKGLSNLDSSKETLLFNSGVDYTYVQDFYERKPGALDKWQIKGKFERKNNKITFYERVKDGTQQQPEITYKYEMEEGKTLTLIVEGEGYPDDKKVYTRIN
ncbi:MAG TPA: hypothetical protein PKX15_07380 [Bacteroidales bacterium]|nr:hypothetical protein [Bacteroidales bacterium]